MSDDSQSPEPRRQSLSDMSSPAAIDDDEVKDLVDEGSLKSSRPTNGVKGDDDMIDDDDEDAGGLFGSGSEDEDQKPAQKHRTLDDEELDSGDDVDRRDRMEEDLDPEAYEQREVLTASVSLARHALPKGSDGELYLLRHPNYVGIEPKAFNPHSFQVPTTGHHGKPPPAAFSAAQTSNTTIRWRRNPDNYGKLQSNARILRWSDGSLTLQIGSNPMEQLQLPGKPLAPSQQKPITPTPISVKANHAPYNHLQDSHTYLASTHHNVGFVQLTNHVTTSLSMQATTEETDDALIRLQENMAAALRGTKGEGAGPAPIAVTEDPELAKRKAEVAEREKLRAERRRINQEQRQRDRGIGIGRPGARAPYGLTAAGLEDELGGGGKPRPKARKPRRRGSEYSDDEGDYRRKTKEDEYDLDDGFMVGSDEEPEVVEDDDEEEELLDEDAEGDDDVDDAPTKSRSPKRSRDEEDADADGAGGGRRRRRVLDDDEEDD